MSSCSSNIVPGDHLEHIYRENGLQLIAGVDEAGRGALAGPVVAAAVILPEDTSVFIANGVKDSKKITESKREELYDFIIKNSVSYGIGVISPYEIDRMNILQASRLAMRHAVENLAPRPQIILIDGPMRIDMQIPQTPIVGGDRTCISIAAASIIAKVTRDRIMRDKHPAYPQYNFIKNKGYGTLQHRKAIQKYGPSPIHRKSFSPVQNMNLFDLGEKKKSNGKKWEVKAASFLADKGYSIIAKNFRIKGGEVDLIAKHGDTWVFVEVKARKTTSFGHPAEHLKDEQKNRIKNAACLFLRKNGINFTKVDLRFDVVAIIHGDEKNETVMHFENAF